MKMTELRAENESLKQQIQLLSQQKEDNKGDATINQLKEKNRSFKKSIKDLKAEKVTLSGQIQTLETEKSSIEQSHRLLKADFEQIQQQFSTLSDAYAQTITEVESLRVDLKALQEKASQLPIILLEVDRLRQVENVSNEKTTQVVALQAELEQRSQLVEDIRAKATKDVAKVEDQKAKLNSEMETVRGKLLAELDTLRDQSKAQIGSLQSQNNGLSTKITELTEKLKLVATSLQKQLTEKRSIAYQYDTSLKEHQTYKDQAEKKINELMALLQKMAAELDASRSSHLVKDTQPVKVGGDNKPANLANPLAINKQHQRSLQELEDQLSELDEINASQARELATLSARMKRVNLALTTPIGRLVSQLLGLND